MDCSLKLDLNDVSLPHFRPMVYLLFAMTRRCDLFVVGGCSKSSTETANKVMLPSFLIPLSSLSYQDHSTMIPGPSILGNQVTNDESYGQYLSVIA